MEETRFAALEASVNKQRIELVAHECALRAIAGETDWAFRLGLFEDMRELVVAQWENEPDPRVERDVEIFRAACDRLWDTFVRAATPHEALIPERRKATGIRTFTAPRR